MELHQVRRAACLPFLLEPDPSGEVSQVRQRSRRREGIRDIGSGAKEGPKRGRVTCDQVCGNYVADTAVRVSVCLCVLSVRQSQSGTAA